jgi:DNA-binding NarL/FixJ family response regulator
MPRLDGIATVRQIAADPRLRHVRLVILTTFETDAYVFDALRAGASGFLVKDTDPAELLRAVRVVSGGEALLSPGVTPPHRRVRVDGSDAAAARASTSSPSESARSWRSWPPACRTTRSPSGLSSARPRPSPTSAA